MPCPGQRVAAPRWSPLTAGPDSAGQVKQPREVLFPSRPECTFQCMFNSFVGAAVASSPATLSTEYLAFTKSVTQHQGEHWGRGELRKVKGPPTALVRNCAQGQQRGLSRRRLCLSYYCLGVTNDRNPPDVLRPHISPLRNPGGTFDQHMKSSYWNCQAQACAACREARRAGWQSFACHSLFTCSCCGSFCSHFFHNAVIYC